MLVRTRQHATSIFDLAEDLAQEALVQAVTGLPKIREPEAFLAWLKVIVDRVIATHHGQARPGAPDHSVDLEVLPDAGTTDQAALNSVDVEMVRRAVAALPPKSRLMVELVYFEGMTCAEVAEFLRVSREAVKSTLHRSRKRLRRSVRAVSITETEQATLCASMVSGEHTPGGPLFGHDSDIARFYVALYPRGLPDRAAEEAEVTSQRANELMAFLEDRRLVARENGVVRCTMPVVSDVDLQVLHPWATEAADVFHRELDSIVEQATAIAHTVGHLIAPGSEPRSTGQNHPVVEQLRDSSCSRSAEQTVLAAALHEARVLALHRFENAMRVSAPDRGAHGKWTAAVTTAEAFPQGQHGHMSSAHQETAYGVFRYCYLHPSGVDRSEVEDFVRRLCLPAVPHSVTHVAPGRELFHFLHSLTVSPVNDGEVADRLAEFGLYVDDPVAFVDECERLRAIRREGGQSLNAVPLIPLGPWLEFCAHMERIGNAVVETIGENAEELRNRLTRCSFAHCNLADAVTACIMYLRGLVGDEIVRRGLAEVPETADFSWGALLVC